jgi:hypothetical protein
MYYLFRQLILNIILSKLYSTSLLTSLNSRRGRVYDTSENTEDDSDLSNNFNLNLRFASNSMDDRTPTTVAIPPLLVSLYPRYHDNGIH